jgi:hypothetical protein
MSDETHPDNQFDLQRQTGAVPAYDAPGCTNPGGAFTSERDGRIYQFCSEGRRAKFEGIPQT